MFGQLAFDEPPEGAVVPDGAVVADGVVVVVVGMVAVDELEAAFAITAPPPARAPTTIVVASAFRVRVGIMRCGQLLS
ncbi:MAG TPA: hypothetical protein VG265_04900 [Gaiellaceae bacterium]|jgi:hypothetical protein|nr:hypothetical protein [Gaiellaceae bacterium]